MTLSPTSFIACLAYGYNLTPWACIQNQLGLVLPVHPCWNCQMPVIIEKAPETIIGKMELSLTKIRKVPPGMTPAVARALGLIAVLVLLAGGCNLGTAAI